MHPVLKRLFELPPDEQYCILSKDDIICIHHASLNLLQTMGCGIQNKRMLSILSEAGYEVDESSMVVRFDQDTIESLIEKHRQHEIRSIPQRLQASISGLTSRIYDPELDSTRPATKKDLENACIIGEALDDIAAVAPLFIPQDVPKVNAAIHQVQAIVTRTRKACGFELLRKDSLKPIREILTVAAGSWDSAVEQYHPMYGSFISSPLRYTDEPLDIAFEALDMGYSVRFGAPMIVAGATGPVTFAGALAVSNAEALVGLVLSDLMEQTWSYAAAPVLLDPQTMQTAYSGPDRSILAMTTIDLCRFYGNPSGAHIGFTDAVTPDFQSGFERGYGLLLQLIGGLWPGLACGLTGPGGNCGCLEQILLDVECVKAVERMLQPIEVNDETLSLDLIRERGIGGGFLDSEHTVKHLRETMWFPKLMIRMSDEDYNHTKATPYTRAKSRVREILEQNDPHILTFEQEKEIARIVSLADAEHGV